MAQSHSPLVWTEDFSVHFIVGMFLTFKNLSAYFFFTIVFILPIGNNLLRDISIYLSYITTETVGNHAVLNTMPTLFKSTDALSPILIIYLG